MDISTLGQLWGSAKKSNWNKIQVFLQNITFKKLTNAPVFVSNLTLHQDLGIQPVSAEVELFYNKRFFAKLEKHPSPLIKNLHTFTLPGNSQNADSKGNSVMII
ncbi:Uncharacterized protein FWK35_00018084 [Aphis craccivora]|uniref:Uncharacterized protein n=1 Tax=Aphis craccivora TaxID=307492 RepID=A0A6G0YC52_APHCR|nr:Uncharacterized protein FWK35_00018084 [Aphis craccivora]